MKRLPTKKKVARREPVPFTRATVSLPPELFAAGTKKAETQRRTFSNYVAHLIEMDAV